jgi:hypothetical protein
MIAIVKHPEGVVDDPVWLMDCPHCQRNESVAENSMQARDKIARSHISESKTCTQFSASLLRARLG